MATIEPIDKFSDCIFQTLEKRFREDSEKCIDKAVEEYRAKLRMHCNRLISQVVIELFETVKFDQRGVDLAITVKNKI